MSVERQIEILRKNFQEKMRLIEAVRRLIETYEEDIAKLQNERNKIEHELFVLEIEERKEKEQEKEKEKEKEDALCFSKSNEREGGVSKKRF